MKQHKGMTLEEQIKKQKANQEKLLKANKGKSEEKPKPKDK